MTKKKLKILKEMFKKSKYIHLKGKNNVFKFAMTLDDDSFEYIKTLILKQDLEDD